MTVGPKSPQMDGVATSGVALQEQEQCARTVAVCKNKRSVQEQAHARTEGQ